LQNLNQTQPSQMDLETEGEDAVDKEKHVAEGLS
jgi:hypothetical protein